MDGERVQAWTDVRAPVSVTALTQASMGSRPVFRAKGMNGAPAVEFNGSGFLQGELQLPAAKTIVAAVYVGSKAGSCCDSVAVAWTGGASGASTN